MFRKKIIAISASFFLILVSACNLPGGPAPVRGSDQDPTVAIQTQVAGIVASTAAAQTALSNAVASTLAAMATNTPEFTFTPSFTPTPAFTLTPSFPTVSVSVETNCRTGPGTVYDKLGVLFVGQTADVVGRNAETDNWIIKLPSNPVVTCWLWGKYATLVGNTSGLPNIKPPPTPTPLASPTQPPDLLLTYDSFPFCVTWAEWYIVFKIVNTGGLTWESYQLAVTDEDSHLTSTVNADYFSTRNKCGSDPSSDNLGPGVTMIISSGHFDTNPSGHHFSATIKVCSGEGKSGSCLVKTITFIP